jgi:peroxiredoxin
MRTAALLIAFATVPVIAAEVPRKAPELVVQLPQGGQKLLSDYRGKVVCVEFLFTTCPHCQHSSQVLSRLQNEFGPRGFQALGIAFNPMAKMLVPEFVQHYRVNFPVGYAERDPVNAFLQNPPENALHVPQLVFIDRKGMVRKQSLPRNDNETGTEANIRKTIEQLLAEPASPAKRSPRSTAKKKAS